MANDPLINRTIGRYEIMEAIGAGYVAKVYRAYQYGVNRTVAFKVFPREFLDDPGFMERFEAEMRAISALDSPQIVPIYDVGQSDGMPYAVMRYMGGGNLAAKLKQGPLSLAQAVPIVRQIASGLDYAHDRGAIHRNLSATNILFDEQGKVGISDFITANVLKATLAITGLRTRGSATYLAPEMSTGNHPITRSVDIYALGILVFEMLAGRPPYTGESPVQVAMKHVEQPIPFLQTINASIPREVDLMLEGALAKEPDERYDRAGLLAAALAKAAGMVSEEEKEADTDTTNILPAAVLEAAMLDLEDNELMTVDLPPLTLKPEAASEPDTGPYKVDFAIGKDAPTGAETLTPEAPPQVEEAERPRAEAQRPTPTPTPTPTKTQAEAKPKRASRPAYSGGWRWYTISLVIFTLLFVWFGLGTLVGFEAREQVNALTINAIHVVQTGEVSTAAAEVSATENAIQRATEIAILETATAVAVASEESATLLPSPTDTPTPTATPAGGGAGLIAFVSEQDGDADIYIFDLFTRSTRQLTRNAVRDNGPEWSPDGTRIAFDSSTGGAGRHIYLMDADGESEAIQLTEGVRQDTDPHWSADRSRLAFLSVDGGRHYIRVLDIQTETETDVVQLPNILELLDWSNDGTRFTFYGSTIEGVLETIAIPNGGESTSRFAITQAFGDISFVSYSPDRTQLVYTATANFPSRRIQVFLANADCPLVNLESCRIRRVTEDSFNYAYPRFSPDGSRLLVSSDRSGNMDLYIMDLEGNIIDRLTESGFDEYDAVWQPIPR